MAIFITGVAGFVGSNLAKYFIDNGFVVFGVDNLSRGKLKNLASIENDKSFHFYNVDIIYRDVYRKVFNACHKKHPISEVWHMAANSDIQAGVTDSSVDLKDTFMTTFNTLEMMKEVGVSAFAFASSSAIYGDFGESTLYENIGPLMPISNYGAMKLASEAIIYAAAESYLDRAFIFRFPNVIGVPATHGVILDFVRKLALMPGNLPVLGDGSQQKSYLHVDDLINAMIYIVKESKERVSVFNIGPDDLGVSVSFIAQEVVKLIAPNAKITYGLDKKGWVGDVPRFVYSIDKLKKLGWGPTLSSVEAVAKALNEIVVQERKRNL